MRRDADTARAVRPARPSDAAAIRRIHELAFGGRAEADLVEALGRAGAATVSLVALEGDSLAGHILFSPVTVEPPAAARLAGLAPMAVLPERQRKGVGALLVERGLEGCRRACFSAVIVLGHADYYPRFGFAPASRWGLRSTWSVPDEVFLALELRPGALSGVRGTVRYRSEFDGF